MKLAIVGFELEGKAAYNYWLGQGADVTICDQDPAKDVPDGVDKQLGENYLKDLYRFDLVFRTAGIHPNIILRENPTLADKLTTTMNEFLRVCPTKHVIGITGTKGKGTTSTLVAKMLGAAGKQVYLGGNIGVSPFDFLPQLTEDSWVVLELSSFQLIDLRYSPSVAVCLMTVPEHLNWHSDVAEYIEAKSQLFKWQRSEDIALYFAESETSQQIAGAGLGHKIPYFAPPGAHLVNENIVIDDQIISSVHDLKLLGRHNWQNACAAVTTAWFSLSRAQGRVTQDVEAMRSVLTSFSGLEHRLQLIRELNGVKYYDDSFGTTPETAMVAIQAFEEPKVVILGGSDKGANYEELARTVKDTNVRSAVTIGATGPAIKAALQQAGVTKVVDGGSDIESIVQTVRSLAQSGDVVLLSTGCASFDMFKNYKDRGEQFRQAVLALV